MLIIGLQCGHDAAVTVVADGRVLVHMERERKARERHVTAMSGDLIDDALAFCGLTADDIDCFALCTTQSTNYLSTDGARLKFDYDWSTAERIGEGHFSKPLHARCLTLARMLSYRVPNVASGPSSLFNIEWPDNTPSLWHRAGGMDAIDELGAEDLAPVFETDDFARSCVMSMRVTFDGRVFPAVGVMHQLAHAAAAFYQSPFEAAPVLSHDNGSPFGARGYTGGMVFYGEGRRLVPIWRARIAAGLVYSRTAKLIGLGAAAGPGKLMGLSAYGTPDFHDGRLVGDVMALSDVYRALDQRATFPDEQWDETRGWAHAIRSGGIRAGFPPLTEPFCAFGHQIAASTQRLFEDLTLYATGRIERLLSIVGRMSPDLALSGGCALNCPANSRIVEETPFERVFVPPSCDDGGLSTGAALYVCHHVLGRERDGSTPFDRNIGYLGRSTNRQEIEASLVGRSQTVICEERVDVADRVARDIADDRIVAVFDGRAESGPRALGHRSLLADPRRRETWDRVNRVKGREWWRPFAPACLSERLRDHFDGGPRHSPHMLFNYRVRSRDLGAVTHVDGTARTQTVERDGGRFRAILEAFEARTGVPVVLNTSFNGPGEPIVDTADDALRFLENSEIDALYLDDYRIVIRS